MVTSPFWILGPLFVQQSGYELPTVALFMSTTIVGGVLLQLPLGRYSDSVDRRRLIAAVFFAVALASLSLVLWAELSFLSLLITAFLFGGFAFALYSLCVAHVNDVMIDGDRIAVSAGLLLVFGAGAVVGPILASQVYNLIGPNGLFIYTSIIGFIGGLYALIRLWRRLSPTQEQKEPFVVVLRTTPAIFDLDPRNASDSGDAGKGNSSQT